MSAGKAGIRYTLTEVALALLVGAGLAAAASIAIEPEPACEPGPDCERLADSIAQALEDNDAIEFSAPTAGSLLREEGESEAHSSAWPARSRGWEKGATESGLPPDAETHGRSGAIP